MVLSLPQATRPLAGVVQVPGDKSLAHRAALFAALAEGESEVANYPDSGVTRAMRGALDSLGVPSSLEGGVLRIKGNGMRPFPNSGATAYCGNSATTIRLLAGAVVATRSSAGIASKPSTSSAKFSLIASPTIASKSLTSLTSWPLRCPRTTSWSHMWRLPFAGDSISRRYTICNGCASRPGRRHGIREGQSGGQPLPECLPCPRRRFSLRPCGSGCVRSPAAHRVG